MQLFDNGGGGYGSCLVNFLRALDAVVDGVLGGEAGGRGELVVRLACVRSPTSSGRHGEDMDALSTGWSLFNSCLGPHEATRWTRGVRLDTVGWHGGLCELEREERGKHGARALFALKGLVMQGTREPRWWAQKREGIAGNTGEGQWLRVL